MSGWRLYIWVVIFDLTTPQLSYAYQVEESWVPAIHVCSAFQMSSLPTLYLNASRISMSDDAALVCIFTVSLHRSHLLMYLLIILPLLEPFAMVIIGRGI